MLSEMNDTRIAAAILAAGKGTRLKTAWPKVLHPVCGRPMLAHVIDACRSVGVQQCLVVVGYGKDMVIKAFESDNRGLVWVEQAQQLGTGHAVMVCRDQIAGKLDHVLILCGDGPLIHSDTIKQLLARHLAEGNAATLATAELEDPTGYGRIARDASGMLVGIVEEGNCTQEQLGIREVNPSYYCFRVPELLTALEQIKPDSAKGEYYITDCIALLIEAGHKVDAITAVPPADVYSINTRKDLALVNRVMQDRTNEVLMESGVTIVDPANTWIDARARIGQDTVIHPFVCIEGRARIGRNCSLGPFAHIPEGTEIGDNVAMAALRGPIR